MYEKISLSVYFFIHYHSVTRAHTIITGSPGEEIGRQYILLLVLFTQGLRLDQDEHNFSYLMFSFLEGALSSYQQPIFLQRLRFCFLRHHHYVYFFLALHSYFSQQLSSCKDDIDDDHEFSFYFLFSSFKTRWKSMWWSFLATRRTDGFLPLTVIYLLGILT